MGVKGIDVSNHQGQINWNEVSRGDVKFAFIKATESADFFDPWFKRNWTEAKRVGLVRGAYHFARPSQNPDPTVEAYWFLDKIEHELLEVGDILILDAEDDKVVSGTDVSEWYQFWLEIVESIVQFKPLIYTGKWYLDSWMFKRPDKMKQWPLWLSAYQTTKPPAPSPWSGYEFWQFTDRGTINGVRGNCDVNDFSGLVTDLPAYGKPIIVPPKPELDLEAVRQHLDNISQYTFEADKLLDRINVERNAIWDLIK